MLSPDYLEKLPEALIELWQQVEDDILQDLGRRIAQMRDLDALTPAAQWQAWRLEQSQLVRKGVLSILAKYSGKSKEEIRRLLLDAGRETLASDDAIYKAAGLTPSPIEENETLNNLLNAGYRQTLGTWQNLTATTAATVTGAFEKRLDEAWLQISSGAFDYDTAIRRAVENLADQMPGVTYPSGHRDTLEVAVRRAVLTGVNQTCAKLQLARADEMGCEFVEVTAHEGARPEHALWQGKIYHRGGAIVYEGVRYEDFETATGYGTGPGLCGWNCRHNFYPFFPGISVPNYTAERLAALSAKTVEYDGKLYTRYEITQMQRALERRVRKYKRRFVALRAAKADTTATSVRLRDARRALSRFLEEPDGKLDSGRTDVAGFSYPEAALSTAQANAPFEAFRKENLAAGEEDLLPGHAQAVIPQEKLTGYALNLDHPKGADKAVAFRDVLGYTKENAPALAAALRDGLGQWKARPRPATRYGQPYEVKMILTGANGRQATAKTGWLVEEAGTAPRLISVYLYKQK